MTTMQRVRPAAVAGSFYPSPRDVLEREVDRLLVTAHVPDADHLPEHAPTALIVPHAGYVYSGPVAASAYALLRRWHRDVRRVVLIGPAHRAFVRGMALPSVDAFRTPLGDVPIDRATCDRILRCAGVEVDDEAHEFEHSLEVHLPFLQRVLDDGWSLVPIVIGATNANDVAEVLAQVWGEEGTVVVVSTDLSHYHDHATAHLLDRATAAAIVARDWEVLDGDRACGVIGVSGALELARRRHEHVDLLDLRDSSDTAGPDDRVVGYGSFVIRDSLDRHELRLLLEVARVAVRSAATGTHPEAPDPSNFPPALGALGAAFVTLERHGQLRGCIGTLQATEPLVCCVAAHARAAALHDPRFPPLHESELHDLEVSVSVLSTPAPMSVQGYDELLMAVRPGTDGLVVDCSKGRATLLPSVWDELPDTESFVAALWSKAGLSPREWPVGVRMSRYTAQHT